MKDKLRILYATDFLPSSTVALELLKSLDKKFDTDITFLHVITSFWQDWFTSGLYEKEAKSRLEEWYKRVKTGNPDLSKIMVFKGNAADYITMQAGIMEADLIVVGGGGDPKSHKDFITGTTAEAIVRYSRQSVLLVKKPTIESIICGVDGSVHSEKALKRAIDLAKRFSASLKIVHVIPNADFNPLGMRKEDIIENENKFKEMRIQEIEEFLKAIEYYGVKPEVHHVWGVASHVLLSLAEDDDADMIIIGATGRGKLASLIIGTTASHTMRKAPCSLYIVK